MSRPFPLSDKKWPTLDTGQGTLSAARLCVWNTVHSTRKAALSISPARATCCAQSRSPLQHPRPDTYVHIQFKGSERVKVHTRLLLLIRMCILLLRGRGAILGPGWGILLRWLVILRGQLHWVVGRGRQALLWGHARPACTCRLGFLSMSAI